MFPSEIHQKPLKLLRSAAPTALTLCRFLSPVYGWENFVNFFVNRTLLLANRSYKGIRNLNVNFFVN